MYTSSRVAWLHYIHVFLRIYTNKPQLKYTVTVDTPNQLAVSPIASVNGFYLFDQVKHTRILRNTTRR